MYQASCQLTSLIGDSVNLVYLHVRFLSQLIGSELARSLFTDGANFATDRTENYLFIIKACIPTLEALYQRTSQLYSQYRGSQKKDKAQQSSPLYHLAIIEINFETIIGMTVSPSLRSLIRCH